MIQGVICGKGGQGVITLNAMIGSLAAEMGLKAVSAETHGMAMRGGSVATYIKIGGSLSASVAEGSADFIISLTKDEALRNITYIKDGGTIIMDSSSASGISGNLRLIPLDATKIASEKFGNPIYAGQILLGIFLGCYKEIDTDKAMNILSSVPKICIDAVRFGVEYA